jgi:uncharacterized phage infection (PIP) family protein YhgE
LKVDSLTAAGAAITVVFIVVIVVMVGKTFPLQAFGSPPQAFEPTALGQKIGLYLWGMRSWDLTVVALILFFSALGCIAMLRGEGRDR